VHEWRVGRALAAAGVGLAQTERREQKSNRGLQSIRH